MMDINSQTMNPKDLLLNYTLEVGGRAETYSVYFGTLDNYEVQSLRSCTVYSVGIGSCLALLFLLWIIIKNKKTPIFIMNQLTLLVMVTRSSLCLAYLMGPLSALSFSFTGILIPDSFSSYRVTVAANGFQIILVALIEMSMTYQIFIIFRSPEVKRLGFILTTLAGLIGLTIVGFYINSTIATSKIYRDIFSNGATTHRVGTWVTNVPFIIFSASINVMSLILVSKLVFAIKTRRYLGLRQFDSLHILMIMSTQTMIVPSILVIINYSKTSEKDTLISTISILLVVLSLPLSSMWAAAANNSINPTSATLAFINRSNSNCSDNDTIVGNTFSFFPSKLSKIYTPDSDLEKNTLSELPLTFGPLKRNEPTSADTFFTDMTMIPPDIEEIINDNGDLGMPMNDKHLSCYSDNGSIDGILNNVTANDFVAITTHNVKK